MRRKKEEGENVGVRYPWISTYPNVREVIMNKLYNNDQDCPKRAQLPDSFETTRPQSEIKRYTTVKET